MYVQLQNLMWIMVVLDAAGPLQRSAGLGMGARLMRKWHLLMFPTGDTPRNHHLHRDGSGQRSLRFVQSTFRTSPPAGLPPPCWCSPEDAAMSKILIKHQFCLT